MGNVSLYYALIHSMNVPSLKVLDGIGFDAAINRAVALLGIYRQKEKIIEIRTNRYLL